MTNPNKDAVPEGALQAAVVAALYEWSAIESEAFNETPRRFEFVAPYHPRVIAAALAAALPFLVQPQAGIEVKALVWGLLTTEDGLEAQDAHCSIGHYIATSNGWFLAGQTGLNSASNLVDAKIAADGDFEARVSQPLPSPQGEAAKNLRRALETIRDLAGKTLISVEHGQPYSIGANAAFEDAAHIAAEALRSEPLQTKEPGNGK